MLIKAEKAKELKTIDTFKMEAGLHKKILQYCKTGKFDMPDFFRGAANYLFEQEDKLKKNNAKLRKEKSITKNNKAVA